MAKDLTEADAFSAPITVPEGTDFMDDAAGQVESIAQKLANRTKNLNTHGAKKDVAQTFTQLQTFGAGLTVSAGDATIPSVAGDMHLNSGSLFAATVNSDSGDIYSSDDVIAQDEFQYGAPLPTRTKEINILSGNGGTGAGTPINDGEYISLPVAARWFIPIQLPHGAVLNTIRVKMLGAVGNADVDAHVYKRTAPNYGATTLPAYVLQGSAGTTTVGITDWISITPSFSAITINKNETYSLSIECKSGSANAAIVGSIEVTFVDPGPRNH